jgi:DNA-binding response OmpR family regulator
MPLHAKTPVIFVTALSGFESRAKSSLSGGDDFIGKPFSYIELAVKGLIYVLRESLGEEGSVARTRPMAAVTAATDPVAVAS